MVKSNKHLPPFSAWTIPWLFFSWFLAYFHVFFAVFMETSCVVFYNFKSVICHPKIKRLSTFSAGCLTQVKINKRRALNSDFTETTKASSTTRAHRLAYRHSSVVIGHRLAVRIKEIVVISALSVSRRQGHGIGLLPWGQRQLVGFSTVSVPGWQGKCIDSFIGKSGFPLSGRQRQDVLCVTANAVRNKLRVSLCIPQWQWRGIAGIASWRQGQDVFALLTTEMHSIPWRWQLWVVI